MSILTLLIGKDVWPLACFISARGDGHACLLKKMEEQSIAFRLLAPSAWNGMGEQK